MHNNNKPWFNVRSHIFGGKAPFILFNPRETFFCFFFGESKKIVFRLQRNKKSESSHANLSNFSLLGIHQANDAVNYIEKLLTQRRSFKGFHQRREWNLIDKIFALLWPNNRPFSWWLTSSVTSLTNIKQLLTGDRSAQQNCYLIFLLFCNSRFASFCGATGNEIFCWIRWISRKRKARGTKTSEKRVLRRDLPLWLAISICS